MSTSDAYVDETLMPWFPKDNQRVTAPVPHPADAASDQPPGVPAPPDQPTAGVLPTAVDLPSELSLDAIYHRVTRRQAPRGMRSRTVLILFSGSYQRPDGITAFLARYGISAVMVDNDAATGGTHLTTYCMTRFTSHSYNDAIQVNSMQCSPRRRAPHSQLHAFF